MVTLRRIGVRSAGNLGFWFGVAFGVINFVFFLIILLFVFGVPLRELPSELWVRVAIGLVLGGLQTAFSFGMMAFIYNRISGNFGGLQLEFSAPIAPAPQEKAKTGDADGETPEIV